MKSATKMVEVRKQLSEFCAGLDVQAEIAGRPGVKANELLREAYGLKEGAKLHTFEGVVMSAKVKRHSRFGVSRARGKVGARWCSCSPRHKSLLPRKEARND